MLQKSIPTRIPPRRPTLHKAHILIPVRRNSHSIGAVIVWAAIIAASAVILAGTPYVGQMLVVLGGGAVWFVVLVPAAIFKEE